LPSPKSGKGSRFFCIPWSLLQNSKNTLRPFGKLSAQGERYFDYSIRGELIEPPFPFVMSLSSNLSRSW